MTVLRGGVCAQLLFLAGLADGSCDVAGTNARVCASASTANFDEVVLLQSESALQRRSLESNTKGRANDRRNKNTTLMLARNQTIFATGSSSSGTSNESMWPMHLSPIHGCRGFDCVQQYVDLPDDSYHWKDTGYVIQGRGSHFDKHGNSDASSGIPWKGYVLNMTSQTWLLDEVSHPVWWHTMLVIVPENRRVKDWATLHLAFGKHSIDGSGSYQGFDNRPGGAWQDSLKPIIIDENSLGENLENLKSAAQEAAHVATRTGSIAATLLNLPNGYEVFGDDPKRYKRSADGVRAWTYTEFLVHHDHPELLFELPVAKAAVRAMDTIAAFSKSLPHADEVKQFAVTGYSKLGQASLVTGAVDKRVKMIVPVATGLSIVPPEHEAGPDPEERSRWTVIEQSDTNPGKDWTAEYKADYIEGNAGDPVAMKMHSIVDPAAWPSKCTKPMLMQSGTSDLVMGPVGNFEHYKWWLPLMPAPVSMNFVANSRHHNTMWEALPSTVAFIAGHMHGKTAPNITELFGEDPASGTSLFLEVKQHSHHKPVSVEKWHHYGEFRKCAEGNCPVWDSAGLIEETSPGSGKWRHDVQYAVGRAEKPALGVFMSLTYEWPSPGHQFTVSSMLYRTKAPRSIWYPNRMGPF